MRDAGEWAARSTNARWDAAAEQFDIIFDL